MYTYLYKTAIKTKILINRLLQDRENLDNQDFFGKPLAHELEYIIELIDNSLKGCDIDKNDLKSLNDGIPNLGIVISSVILFLELYDNITNESFIELKEKYEKYYEQIKKEA